MHYLITFNCYGKIVPGEAGCIRRQRKSEDASFFPENPQLARAVRSRMPEPPYILDPCRRATVLTAMLEVCTYRRWNLLAAHVRSNHVHVVLDVVCTPERVMNTFKLYASRALNLKGIDGQIRRWARHGSTRYLRTPEQVRRAIRYVLTQQGEPMNWYRAPERDEIELARDPSLTLGV